MANWLRKDGTLARMLYLLRYAGFWIDDFDNRTRVRINLFYRGRATKDAIRSSAISSR
jgi:hypothetical protein